MDVDEVEVFRLKSQTTGEWVIWDLQRYHLARDPSLVCMGCVIQGSSPERADQLIADLYRRGLFAGHQLVAERRIVFRPRWCQYVPLRRP